MALPSEIFASVPVCRSKFLNGSAESTCTVSAFLETSLVVLGVTCVELCGWLPAGPSTSAAAGADVKGKGPASPEQDRGKKDAKAAKKEAKAQVREAAPQPFIVPLLGGLPSKGIPGSVLRRPSISSSSCIPLQGQ